MSERKLRRALTSSLLVTALCLTATAHANAGERTRRQDGRRAAARIAPQPALSVWSVLSALWEKASVRIDPEGARISVHDPDGAKASVRIDPEGRE